MSKRRWTCGRLRRGPPRQRCALAARPSNRRRRCRERTGDGLSPGGPVRVSFSCFVFVCESVAFWLKGLESLPEPVVLRACICVQDGSLSMQWEQAARTGALFLRTLEAKVEVAVRHGWHTGFVSPDARRAGYHWGCHDETETRGGKGKWDHEVRIFHKFLRWFLVSLWWH